MVIARSCRRRHRQAVLLTATALGLTLTSPPAIAQDPIPSNQPPDASADTEQAAGGDIVVTGSRIPQPNLTSEAPRVSLGEQDIERTGEVQVAALLSELPQFGNALTNANQGQNTANASFGTGVELVNLRNLGVQRTLVLVNGRRHVGGDPGTSSVDLNAIPTSLIKRIDVVTGAASAVYGADAVSGVVNIILDDDLEGARVSGRSGISSRGDDAEYRFAAALGSSFNDDHGHFLVGGEYYKSDGFLGGQRPYGFADGLNGLVTPAGGSSGIPGARISGGANGDFIFNSSNQLVPAATAPISETRFQRVPIRSQQSANERYAIALTASHQITDRGDFTAEAYVESSYAHADTRLQIEPQVIFFQGLPRLGTPTESPADAPRVPVDNPFLRALIPTIGAIPAQGVQVFRRFSEEGARFIDVERETFRIVGGVRGKLPAAFTYDVYYQFGHVTSRQDETGVLDRNRLFAALNVDDNGTPANLSDDRCRDARYAALGCLPVNLFGVGAVSQAFLDYATIPSISLTDVKQTVVSGFVTGNLLELPGGPLNIVVGGEYRKEQSRIDPAPSYLDRSSSVRFLDAADGSYDVKEVFGELSVPLLSDRPFFKELKIGGAVRYSDYSTVGGKTSWNLRGDWAIDRNLRVRGTVGTAIRAPNINELYAPISRANSTTIDPCDTVDDNGRPITITGTRATNCSQALGPLAATLDQNQSQRGTTVSQNQGNPTLDAEKATTYTAGLVLTPTFLPRATFSVDYYTISIDQVISNLSLQDTVNQCYDQPGAPAIFCDRVIRDPANGQLLGIRNQLFNAAREKLSGVDAQLLYNLRLTDTVQLDLRANYALLLEHDFIARDGAAVDDRVGQVGDFRHRFQVGSTLTYGAFNFSWDTRYLAHAVADKTATGAAALNNAVPAVWTHDIQFAIDVDPAVLRFGVTNLFDRQPPIITPPSRTATDNTVLGGIYDVRGRFFYVGLSARF